MAATFTRRCDFCGGEIEPGKGMMHVKIDGSVLHFCSSKCAKNALKLRRKPEKVKWTFKHRRAGREA